MKKRLSCSLFVIVFFISFSFPQYNYASDSSSSDKASVDTQLPDMGYEGLLLFRVQLLTPIVLKMSHALGHLHTEYPDYFKLWHQLLADVPETDYRVSRVHKVLHEAEVIFAALATYSKAYQSEIVKAENQIAKDTNIDQGVLTFQQANIDTLIGILERLCQYEAFSQDLLVDLNRLGLEVLSDYTPPLTLQKLNDFEKLRKDQLIIYFKERLLYQNSIQVLSALGSLYNNDTRELFQEKAKNYIDLLEEIVKSDKASGSKSSKLLLQQIKQVAKTKARAFLAMDATFSEGNDGQAWSILFTPASWDKAPVSTHVLDQRRMARHLVATLDAMRLSLRSLVETLIIRNEVFFQDAFIENDRLRQLRESLALETVRLHRFRTIDKEINAAKISLDNVTENDRIAALYSEIGYLKEDILSFEASILQELIFLNEKAVLTSHPDWPLIQGFIAKQRKWEESWSSHAIKWEESVQLFREYQVNVIKRYTTALRKISTEIQKARLQLQSNPNNNTAKFTHFFDREILQLLTETQGMLLKKQDMVSREEKDPIFASLFGINSKRFWHDFRGQGIGFWRLEKLIQSKKETIDQIRSLSVEDRNNFEWPLKMIKIADALDMVQDIAIIDDEVAVVFGNGYDALILKGLFKPDMPSLEIASAQLQIRPKKHPLLSTLSAVFSPRQAHAGFLSGIKKWGGAVLSQSGKNIANYVVIGAVAAGGLLAGPAAPVVWAAAGAAFKAQLTADVAIATARTAGDAIVSNPNVKKTMNERINTLETAYNISKIVEGGLNLWKGYSGQKEITKGAIKFSDRISKALRGIKGRQGELIRKATKIREFLNKTTRSAATIRRATQMLDNIAAEANGLRIALEQGAKNVAGTVNRFIAAAEAGLKLNEAGGVLATGYGLLPGSDDKKPGEKPETDSDGDGTPDKKDGCAADPKKTAPGVCGCGTPDVDKDKDGTPDCNDECPGDPKKTAQGVCGCDTEDTDSDGDGTPDCNDDCPNDANKTDPGVCDCGREDIDSDADGTPDCNDDCPNDANKTDPGECGCNVPDDDLNVNGIADCKETKDSDGDTIPDINDKCPNDPNKSDPGECGCGVPDNDSNVNGVADCKETKKSGCSSDSECPQGYVCNTSGQCVSPFDKNYDSRNQLMASNAQNRQRTNDAQNIADANLNPDRGEFSSEGVDENLDEIQDFVSAECNDRKPCPAGLTCENGRCAHGHNDCDVDNDCPSGQICNEGNCIKSDNHHDDEASDGGTGQKPSEDKPECSKTIPCQKGFICKNGLCVKKRHRFDCRKGGKCKRGYRCNNRTGKCIKKHRKFDCRKGNKCKSGYRCDRQTGKCKKKRGSGGDGGHHHHHHTPPSHQHADGCVGGKCCKGHQLYCKQNGTTYSYPRTALDKNLDWVCDICKRPFRTKQGRLAPGLRGAQRGDVHCHVSH